MNEDDFDARLKALLAEPSAIPDPAFSDRIIALAAYEQAERRALHLALRRLASETLALSAVLVTFALLARIGPGAADFRDTIPLASPAMFGLAMLGLWALVGFRPADASFIGRPSK